MPWTVYSKYVNSPGIYKPKMIPIKILLSVLPTYSWNLAKIVFTWNSKGPSEPKES